MSGTECYSAAEGGSRKRIKTSKTARRDVSNGPASPILIPSDTPMKSESGPSEGVLLSKAEQQQQHHSHTHNGTCHHEQSLRSLHLEMDAMRQLITCKMCYRFLYEPYGLACGHTYCYSCLATWMMKSKTCPDCRVKVKEQPTPTFVIREMVRVFAAKSELLPDGETSEEHEQMAKEEAEIVAKDRANEDVEKGGLFHGRFRKGSRYHPVPAMRDDSDNVWRCPSCMNEVEDGRCGICRIRVRVDGETDDDSTLSDDDDELDGALEDMDYDHDVDLGLHAGVDFGFDGFVDRSSDIDDGPHFYDDNVDMLGFSDSDSDDSEGSMDGFIDEEVHFEDDATVDETEDEAETIRARPSGSQHRRRPVLSDSDSGSDTGGDDDADDDAEEDDRPRSVIPTHRNFDGASSAGASRNTDDEEEDSEEEPISLHSQRSRRRQRAITIDSDDEGQSSDVPPEEGQVDFSNFQAFSPASVRTDDSGAVHLVSDEEDIVNGFAGYGSPDDTQEENGYPTSGEEDDDGPAPLHDTDDDEEDDEANEGEQESDNSDEQSMANGFYV